jgi:YD repeat-containing protein
MKKVSIIFVLLLNVLFAFSQVTYQYDNLYRLQKVEYPNGVKVEYTYDELGNRLTKTVSGAISVARVTVTANNPNMGSVTGGGNYALNSNVTISATPNTGYRFVEWHDGITQNPRTIIVTQDTTFTALFEAVDYQVLLSSNDVSRGTLAGNGTYAFNSVATISATANPGYRFVFWSDGNTDNLRAITVTQDTAFVALFGIEDMYYVYAAPNNPTMGNVTGSDDYNNKKSHGERSPIFKKEYAANSVAIITAIPNNGYRFVRWNDDNTDNPREFTVTGDTIFTAIFDMANIIEDMATSTISIYPNPATDNINITLPENTHQALFTLYDMQGKALIRKEIGNRDVVSVSGLAAGIYVYSVRTATMNYTGKVVKE